MHRRRAAAPIALIAAPLLILFSGPSYQAANEGSPKQTGNRSLFPKAYGLLANERLMFPVDMSDWPVKITGERQLFVDDYLIASGSQLTRQLHQPKRYAGNPVLRVREKPWEHHWGHSVFVLRHPTSSMFRMWYSLQHRIPGENGIMYRGATCYAESVDGIRWTKPDLGIFKYGNDKNNNITLPQGTIEGLFYEPGDPDENRRYKALVWHDPLDQKAYAPREGFYLYWSPDGIHWQGDNQRCIIPNGQGDNFPADLLSGVGDTTHFHWDGKLNRYVANVKILFRKPTLRTVGHSESEDLIHWTRPRMVMYRDPLDEPDSQMYEHITFPYESMWIGLPRVMHTERTGWKQVDVELTCSRDGRHWTRVARGQRFLPLGKEDAWDADYLIPGRPGAPLLVDGKLRFYYWGTRRADKRDGSKKITWLMHIGIATLRRDGFVSLNASGQPGTVTTRPLTFCGSKLFVNAEADNGGYVKAAVLTSKNEALENYTLSHCLPVTTDATRAPVTWKSGENIPLPEGKHVRLKFELKNAKLYSFWIE
jgi:hypothetical protein